MATCTIVEEVTMRVVLKHHAHMDRWSYHVYDAGGVLLGGGSGFTRHDAVKGAGRAARSLTMNHLSLPTAEEKS